MNLCGWQSAATVAGCGRLRSWVVYGKRLEGSGRGAGRE